ncbi:MAG TPA: hypothetical protein VJ521_10875, partial [Acidobacteriota bacterium]|nr:hypothetical protein [Acidobacteriota bacterium]
MTRIARRVVIAAFFISFAAAVLVVGFRAEWTKRQVALESFPISILAKYSRQLPSFASTSHGSLYYSGNRNFWKGEGWLQTQLQSPTAKPLS